MNADLNKIVHFVSELEKLKCVCRQNRTLDNYRAENSAEHSWHAALMALLFQRQFPSNVDLLTVIKMLLIHDIVEIDTGDTLLYDDEARSLAENREQKAAERIFALLPNELGDELMALWREFEERTSPEAKCAAAMDGLQPLINHAITEKEHKNPHGLTKSEVLSKKEFIREISEELWNVAREYIDQGTERGLYIKGR